MAQFFSEGFFRIEVAEEGLTIRPFYRGRWLLAPGGDDRFLMDGRPDRPFQFKRDASGCVTSIETGLLPAPLLRVAEGRDLPLEQVLRGDVRGGAPLLLAEAGGKTEVLLPLVSNLVDTPSLTKTAVALLEELARTRPRDLAVLEMLGEARVAAGDRKGAVVAFHNLLKMDRKNARAIQLLERLRAREPAARDGWTLPFTLDALFAMPGPAELEAVARQLAARKLEPEGVELVLEEKVALAQIPGTMRVVAHRVLGSRRLGVLWIPDGAAARSLALLGEAKGVSPDFFPLRFPEGVALVNMLGPELKRFVIAVPAFRGEQLVLGERTFTSEGDRRDPFDGATDDMLALLSVALATVPQIDPAHVGVFGHSRGGTVALLAGERDARIGCVVDWAGPTDWFRAMAGGGFTPEELIGDALRHRAKPEEDGGQLVDQFLRPAIDAKASLQDRRAKLIGSSPLYFAERLPRAQLHYGADDQHVVLANGTALFDRLERQHRPAGCTEAIVHSHAGHDQDAVAAPAQSKRFLLDCLAAPARQCGSLRW